MKQIIAGKLYDTETATHIASWRFGPFFQEKLFITHKRRIFHPG